MSFDNILQSLISFKTNPLVNYGEDGDSFKQCKKRLKKIQTNSKGYFDLDDYKIFYLNENDINYVIMTISRYPQSSAIDCLNNIKKEFKANFSKTNFESIGYLGLQNDFKEKLILKHEYYNKNLDNDDGDDMGEIFHVNENMIDLSDNLSDSKYLKNESKYYTMIGNESDDEIQIKKKGCNKKTIIIVSIISFFLLIIIAYIIIGFKYDCWKFQCFS